MKLAIVQQAMESTLAENTRNVLEGLSKAKASGADVAVFPECATVGFHRHMAEGVKRESILEVVDRLCKRCAELKINALIGSPYFGSVDQEKPWNVVLAIDDFGALVSVSPKMLFTSGEVRHNIMQTAPSGSRHEFKLAGHIWVALICCEFSGESDKDEDYYREILPILQTKPAIIFVPGLLGLGDKGNDSVFQKAVNAAKELGAYLVVVNWSNWFLPKSDGLGGSFVISPDGETVIEAPMNESAITVATLF